RMSDFGSKPVKHMLVLSLTGCYPSGHFGSIHSICLSALVRRPRDGSVVSFLHCMNDPPAGGSHGKLHRTTKILSHAARWRGGRLAACRARAAASDAGGWAPQQPIARRIRPHGGCVSPGAEGNWVRRRPERGDRIPLGSGSKRSTACPGGGAG